MRYLILVGVILLMLLPMRACAPAPADYIRDAEAFGFRDVHLTGYRWLGCAKDDAYNSGFSATNQDGRRVTGVICRGVFKGGTVRLD